MMNDGHVDHSTHDHNFPPDWTWQPESRVKAGAVCRGRRGAAAAASETELDPESEFENRAVTGTVTYRG